MTKKHATMNDEQLIKALAEQLEESRPYVAKVAEFTNDPFARTRLVQIDGALELVQRRARHRSNPLLTPEQQQRDWAIE
jgi:hypothetical protein